MEQQDITSSGTSINKIAKFCRVAFNTGIIKVGSRVYDYGAGKYIQKAKDYAKKKGFDVVAYDPYNLPQEYNDISFAQLRMVDMICCNNVLNVLTDNALHALCSNLHSIAYMNKLSIYITVYEGNCTGIGKISKKDCYQRHMKVADYIPFLEKYFPMVTCKSGIIKCCVKKALTDLS